MTDLQPCPSEEALFSSILGDADAPDIGEHLQECAICRANVARLKAMVTSLRKTVEGADTEPRPDVKSENAPAAEARPAILGKYLVVGELGRGGQARVFRAVHPGLNRDVAIKWGPHGLGADTIDHLGREGKLLAALDHPGIVRVHDLEVQDGRPFLVMEYVRGCNLAQYVLQETVTPRRAAELTVQLAQALAYAHRQGIIHQDIKPANVLVDENGTPRLGDFGIARLRHLWADGKEQQPSGGTLEYMAPEQLNDPESVSPACDLYALGGVLFFLLTGHGPRFEINNPALAWDQVRKGEIDWGRLNDKRIPRRLAEICRKALAADVKDRYARAEDLAADIQKYLQKPQMWQRRLGYLAACAACIAIGWGLFAFFPRPVDHTPSPVPIPPVLPPPATPLALKLVVHRNGSVYPLVTPKDEDHLPVVETDTVSFFGSLPNAQKYKTGLFAVAISDYDLDLQELEKPEFKGDRFDLKNSVPLDGSPATELVFLCADPQVTPRKDEVAALLQERTPVKFKLTSPKLWPKNRLLTLLPEGVERLYESRTIGNPKLGGPVPTEIQIAERVDSMQKKLKVKYEIVVGVGFTHVKAKPPPPKADGQRASNRNATDAGMGLANLQQANESPEDWVSTSRGKRGSLYWLFRTGEVWSGQMASIDFAFVWLAFCRE